MVASENVNVRITGNLRAHLNRQIGAGGLYENASEYIRDLIRRDLESREDAWQWLLKKLEPGIRAADNEFAKISKKEIIANSKKRHLSDS